jgi:hypothetical protein
VRHVNRPNRILDLIDAGLQSSDETDYGFDGEGCIRCRAKVEEGDFCPGCRAFLLEDSDEDPTRPRGHLPPIIGCPAGVPGGMTLGEAFRRETLMISVIQRPPLVRCPHHGEARGGTCLGCVT